VLPLKKGGGGGKPTLWNYLKNLLQGDGKSEGRTSNLSKETKRKKERGFDHPRPFASPEKKKGDPISRWDRGGNRQSILWGENQDLETKKKRKKTRTKEPVLNDARPSALTPHRRSPCKERGRRTSSEPRMQRTRRVTTQIVLMPVGKIIEANG